MVNINLNIKKKDLWLLSAIMVFLIGVGYVVAYNSGAAPNVMGHSINELERCAEGKILKVSGGLWVCSDDVGLGNWVDVTASAATESNQGPTSSDGFLVIGSVGETSGIYVYTGNNPASLWMVAHENSHGAVSLTVPIKKGDYWRTVIGIGLFDKVYWIPLS